MIPLYVDPAMIPWASACIAAAIVIAVVCSLAFRTEQRRDAWGDSLRPVIAPLGTSGTALSFRIIGDTSKFVTGINQASNTATNLYAQLAPHPRLAVGDRVKAAAEKQRWTVRGVTSGGRFAILTKPFNLRHTVLYSVIDFERGVRGRDNYYGLGYETDEDIAYALGCFQRTEDGTPRTAHVLDAGNQAAEVSRRHYIRLDLQAINGESCWWDGSALLARTEAEGIDAAWEVEGR
jgi:hypothetical protein